MSMHVSAAWIVQSDEWDRPAKTVFDVATQIWPHLDVRDKLSIRQSCKEGLLAHDSLVTTVSIHDLWGRVLPGTPQEIAAPLRRMMRRGCAPRELVLRLRGCSAAAREARGLAVLRALASKRGASSPELCVGGSGSAGGSGSGSSETLNSDGSKATAAIDYSSGSNAGSSSSFSGSSSSCCSSGSSGSSGIGVSAGHCSVFSDRRGGGDIRGGGGGDNGLARSGGNSWGIGAASSCSGSLTTLRLEGVPLTPRVLHALAAGCCLTRLKLYGYNIGECGFAAATDPAGRVRPTDNALGMAATSRVAKKQAHASQQSSPRAPLMSVVQPDPALAAQVESAELRPAESGAEQPPRTAGPRASTATAQAGRRSKGSAPTHGSPEQRGVAALLRLLARQLQELTLQDCCLGGCSGGGAASEGECGGGGVGRIMKDSPSRGGHAGGCQEGHPGKDVDKIRVSALSIRTDDQCGPRGSSTEPTQAAAAAASLQAALQSCVTLRHLGLRHSAATGCPVLQLLLLRDDVSGCGRLGGGPVADGKVLRGPHMSHQGGCSTDSSSGGFGAAFGGGATCAQQAASVRFANRGSAGSHSRPFLATLTQLVSLKLQTALPEPGSMGALAAALMPLMHLTRLELGERVATPSVAALLLPAETAAAAVAVAAMSYKNLRELHLVSAQVTTAAELGALAALHRLTLLSFGSLTLPSLGVETEADEVPASPSPAAPLLLPPSLRELSVASPLPPAALLRLRRPPTLRTLRLTGFTLGELDVVEYGDGGSVGGGAAPLQMRAASERHLAKAVKLLEGRFAYRDLGIELHVGFHGPTACRRRYLAAPGVDRPMGHWAWASRLRPLALQGLELAGLELRESDLSALARELWALEDLRLDCRYPLPAVAHLAGLRRLRRLLLNASFWQPQGPELPPQSVAPPPPALPVLLAPPPAGQAQHQQQEQGSGQGDAETGAQRQQQWRPPRSDADAAAAALTSLCSGASECLYDIALASYGRAAARFCAMQAMVRVEAELPRVSCGALRLWVCP